MDILSTEEKIRQINTRDFPNASNGTEENALKISRILAAQRESDILKLQQDLHLVTVVILQKLIRILHFLQHERDMVKSQLNQKERECETLQVALDSLKRENQQAVAEDKMVHMFACLFACFNFLCFQRKRISLV